MGFTDAEELRNEYIVGAYIRLATEYKDMKAAFENLGRLTREITETRVEEQNLDKNEDD